MTDAPRKPDEKATDRKPNLKRSPGEKPEEKRAKKTVEDMLEEDRFQGTDN